MEIIVDVQRPYMVLNIHSMDNLSWSTNTASLIKKGHQCLYFLHKLKKSTCHEDTEV